MMPRTLGYAVLSLAAAAPIPALAKPVETWAKPGVSFERYRTDAVECGVGVARADVKDEPEAQRFVQGWNNLDRENNTAVWVAKDDTGFVMDRADRLAFIHRRFQPQKNADRLQDKLTSYLQQCLHDRGYSRIRLTRDQARMLKAYRPGTLARHQYLHALAQDPAIVAAQRSE